MSTMLPAEAVTTPLAQLLADVLVGVRRDVPEQVGTAVSVAHPATDRGGGRLQVLAATGIGDVLPPITTGYLWGPSLLAAAGEEPIMTCDLWHDPRWPHLTLDVVCAQLPEEHHDAVSRIRGVVAVPGIWNSGGVVVLSVYMSRPADRRTLAVMTRHEQLVASAITIADIATRSAEKSEQVLNALTARAAIEQAKGAIMAVRGCDATEAWATLRCASQQVQHQAPRDRRGPRRTHRRRPGPAGRQHRRQDRRRRGGPARGGADLADSDTTRLTVTSVRAPAR
jgi:hypothetical protein